MIALTNAISDTIVNQKDKQDHPPTRTKGQTRWKRTGKITNFSTADENEIVEHHSHITNKETATSPCHHDIA